MKKALEAITGLVVGVWFVFGAAEPAKASAIVTLTQVGSNVLASGSGSIDLSALTFNVTDVSLAGLDPDSPFIVVGPTGLSSVDAYNGFSSAPSSFGSGPGILPSTGSGSLFGIANGFLVVPAGYMSKGPLTAATNTYTNATFASLGVTPGTYVWTWGANATADSFTLQIGPAQTAVPEPASLTLFGLGLAGLYAATRRQRRRH